MIRRPLIFLALLLACGLTHAQTRGIPMFKVLKSQGDCTYQPAAGGRYQNVEDGARYPFGTVVKTGRRSQLELELSPGNTFRLLARSKLAIADDASDPKLIRLRVESGSVEVKLDKFAEGKKLQVETPTAVCGAVGTRFKVSFEWDPEEKRTEALASSRQSRFSCDKGEVFVSSRFQFQSGDEAVEGQTLDVPSLPEGSEFVATIHQGLENSYSDITVNRGSLTVNYGGDSTNSSKFKVKAEEGRPARFVCALEQAENDDVDAAALQVKSGVVESESTRRFLFGSKTETTEIKPEDGAVVVNKQQVLQSTRARAAKDYLAAAEEEGKLHSQWVDAVTAGSENANELEVQTRIAAAKATKLRKKLMNRRLLRALRHLRQGQMRPPVTP